MTFVEALVSLLFAAALSAMSYSFTTGILTNGRRQEARRENQEATALAVDVLLREVRIAGFSAAGAELPGIRTASAKRLELVADLNGDGDIDDANERITYSFDADKKALMRATGGGSPQPFLRHLRPDGCSFTFLDAGGTFLAGTNGTLAAAQRGQIARIDVHVERESATPASHIDEMPRLVLSATTEVRNR